MSRKGKVCERETTESKKGKPVMNDERDAGWEDDNGSKDGGKMKKRDKADTNTLLDAFLGQEKCNSTEVSCCECQ